MTDIIRSPRNVGDAIRKIRLEKGLTQTELAARVNVRQATISKLESGEPATRLSTLFDVLMALDMDLHIMPKPNSTPDDTANFEDIY
ncbi:helix-turn-helix domain-containing protein [Hirschia baltica]|uniref:Transcriptional regulator, XRE family n=1 Tax=Hirschia baltica (strain ATCC 49814 / DSM 5838 / IFAM 1418) TaxID=582402 RepID=C6XS07_HIRBI|nr:helix-turn-helix domain-containing protein [Hirschia baltica]ACT60848.1 transcriptional regulator, XRE family [Hirschia baltica ATCC 49814]